MKENNFVKDFELDSKIEEILNIKMALALIKIIYSKNMINTEEYNQIVKEANRTLGLKTKIC